MLSNKVFLCFLRHVVDTKKNVKINELMSTSPSGRILSVDSLENGTSVAQSLIDNVDCKIPHVPKVYGSKPKEETATVLESEENDNYNALDEHSDDETDQHNVDCKVNDNFTASDEHSVGEIYQHSGEQGLTVWEVERDRGISALFIKTYLTTYQQFLNIPQRSEHIESLEVCEIDLENAIEQALVDVREGSGLMPSLENVTNCIGPSSKQQYNFKLCRNLLHPDHTKQSKCLMEDLSWTPISKSVNKEISYNVVLTRDDFDRLAQPRWLNDSLLDFLFRYLLRGTCSDDLIYGLVGCSKYHWIKDTKDKKPCKRNNIQDIKDEKQFKGKKRWSSTRNVLNNELIFMPLHVNENHWVLAVLMQPKLVTTRKITDKGSSCILYLDPLSKHLSANPTVVRSGLLERKLVHDNLLWWLNFELGDDNNSVFDCKTFPLLYVFTNDKWPTQHHKNGYDCGCYVFHFGYVIARWYNGWRCRKTCTSDNEIETLTTSIENNSFIDNSRDLAFELRHQISSLIHSLDEGHTINAFNPDCSETFGTQFANTAQRSSNINIQRHLVINETQKKKSPTKGHIKSLKNTQETSMVTRSVGINNLTRNTIVKCPCLHSSYFEPKVIDKSLVNLFTSFVENNLSQSCPDYFHPIMPGTNSCRMNYQSKQAIRVFYGMRHLEKTPPNEYDVRSVYGPLAVLKSTGGHPSYSYQVLPFTATIEKMSRQLTTFLISKGLTNKSILPFNFLEIKIYLGDDIFLTHYNEAICGSDGNPLRLGCTKEVNPHNDLNFSDEGLQSLTDTACGDHPTVTFTVGSTRRLIFDHVTKDIGQKCWSTMDEQQPVSFDLKHGSVFVLSPEDEKPSNLSRLNTAKHKTKHRVQFRNNGISFAFVFRRVKSVSKFNPVNNRWLWKLENKKTKQKIEQYIEKNGAKYDTFRKSNQCLEIRALNCNIRNFILNLKYNL